MNEKPTVLSAGFFYLCEVNMNKQATLQENWTSETQPNSLCSFDYEAISSPTKALMHQAARFLYFKKGKGKIIIDGQGYHLKPRTLLLITPWMITDIVSVDQTLQLIKVVFDYQFINTLLKNVIGFEKESADLLSFIQNEPIAYLDSVQAESIEYILDQIKAELGVSSTRIAHVEKPMGIMMTTSKIVELMINYRRFILSSRGEKEKMENQFNEKSILSYIYAHSSEHITLESVADVFFISVSSLTKQISDLTGSTFNDLLNRIRVEKTSDYLIYTEISLEEIANLLGFSDASHLSKQFKERSGISPNQFRKLHNKVQSKMKQEDKQIAFLVTDYLYKNYKNEKLNATDVANLFSIGTSQMNQALVYYCEKNFDTLLHFIRINRACHLLAQTDMTILNIALEVGYNNIKTFNLNFFKFKLMNPSDFRSMIAYQEKDGTEIKYQK